MMYQDSLLATVLLALLLQLQPPLATAQDSRLEVTYTLDGQQRAVTEEDLQDLLRDNLQQDLLPWLPSARTHGALTALHFLDLLHEIDTQWPPYRRNFLAVVAIRNNTFTHWSYPTARGWCMRRVKTAAEEFSKYAQTHGLHFPDVIYVMNAYDKPLCAAGTCSAPIFSFGKCWQPAMPSIKCPPADMHPQNLKRRPGSEAISVSAGLALTPETNDRRDDANRAVLNMVDAQGSDEQAGVGEQQQQARRRQGARRAGNSAHRRGGRRRIPLSVASSVLKHKTLHAVHEFDALQPVNCSRQPRGLQAVEEQQGKEQQQLTYHQWQQQLQPPPQQQQQDLQQGSGQHLQHLDGLQTATDRSPYDDILFPVMNHPFDQLISYPWEQKIDVAFMRAGLYAAMSPSCSRAVLYKMAQQQHGSEKLLDVGIYQNRHPSIRTQQAAAVPIEEHARYCYLLNTDGQAASWRLAKLLAINSAVLKWRSPHIEYYYRSLVPGQHYLDVSQHDVLSVLREARLAEQQQRLQQMAGEAQKFAFRYLSQLSRAAYARSALSGYKSLFASGQQELLLDTIVAGGKPNMADLLMLRQRLRGRTKPPERV